MNIEKYFPMLNTNIIYFDNSATTLKPIQVINKEIEYLTTYTASSHRGDYNNSFKVDDEIDNTRELIKTYINAPSKNQIVFTSNATESLNLIINGYFKNHMNKYDEVILNKAEHASNIIPWLVLKNDIGINIKYAPLDNDNKLTLEGIKKVITNKTKVISLSHITNVVGDIRDIDEIIKYAHERNILVVVDSSQSIGHIKTDVTNSDIDFLAFSSHKMLGPTGLGILYAKQRLLEEMTPIKYGGGMNLNYNTEQVDLVEIPYRFEAGTPNISSIIAFSESIKFTNMIGLDYIERKERHLRNYLINELKKIPYIKIYNESSSSGIVLINMDNVSSLELGLYLNTKNICVRSGKHCTKMLSFNNELTDTVRISLYFYNTYEEIDKLINALKDTNSIKNYLKS